VLPSLPALLERIASGDPGAFSAWYDAWFDQALSSARRAARGDEHAAVDITQEVLVRFIRRTPILDSEAAMGAWLRRTALNIALDRAKADQRSSVRDRRHASRQAGTAPPSRSEEGDRLAWLRAELAALDAESESLLVQRFALGRTLAQIGAALGISPSAADGRIGRTLKALRRRAQEVNDEP